MIKLQRKHIEDLLNGIIPSSLNFLKDHLGVFEVRMLPNSESALHLKAQDGTPSPLTLPLDQGVGIPTLINNSWDFFTSPNYNRIVDSLDLSNATLVDIGANVGLFSRQIKARLGDRLAAIYCYEPHPYNYRLLTENLAAIANVTAHNYAVGDARGSMTLHIDSQNAGNYSLSSHAVPAGQKGGGVTVDVRHAGEEFSRLAREIDGSVIYKSDAQGYDPKIAASIPMEFWSKVRMASFELWRLPDSDYDEEGFARVLGQFDHVMFESSFGRDASPAEVIQYLRGRDMKDDDLYVWR